MTRRVDIGGTCGGGGQGRQASPWAWLEPGMSTFVYRAGAMWLANIGVRVLTSCWVVPYLAFTYHIGAAGTDGSWNDWMASYASDNNDTPLGAPTIRN